MNDRAELIRQIEDLDFECAGLRSSLAHATECWKNARADYERERDEVRRLRAIIHRPRTSQLDEVPF